MNKDIPKIIPVLTNASRGFLMCYPVYVGVTTK